MIASTSEMQIDSPSESAESFVPTSSITGEQARRRANGYLTKSVSMYFGAVDPLFLPLESPIWQVSVIFLRNQLGPVHLGFLDIDAQTGQVVPLTDQQIHQLRQRAHAYVTSHSLSTTARS